MLCYQVSCLLITVLLSHAVAQDRPVVKTMYGSIRGQYKKMTRGGRQVAEFLGVRYAKTPTGTLKFKVNIF